MCVCVCVCVCVCACACVCVCWSSEWGHYLVFKNYPCSLWPLLKKVGAFLFVSNLDGLLSSWGCCFRQYNIVLSCCQTIGRHWHSQEEQNWVPEEQFGIWDFFGKLCEVFTTWIWDRVCAREIFCKNVRKQNFNLFSPDDGSFGKTSFHLRQQSFTTSRSTCEWQVWSNERPVGINTMEMKFWFEGGLTPTSPLFYFGQQSLGLFELIPNLRKCCQADGTLWIWPRLRTQSWCRFCLGPCTLCWHGESSGTSQLRTFWLFKLNQLGDMHWQQAQRWACHQVGTSICLELCWK